RDRVARDVALPAAADQIGTKAEPGPLGRNGAIVPERAVRLAHPGPELDLTADGVQHEVPVVRRAVNKMLSLLPLLPAVDPAHLEDVRGTPGDHRVVLEREPLAGDSLRGPQELVLHQLRVHRLGRSADGEGREALDDRRRAVGRLIGFWLEYARPQPACPLLLDDRDAVALRDMEHDVAVPVEAARSVPVDFAS